MASNTDHKFTVQPGKIWYVSLAGNDATGISNNINKPFRTVQDSINSSISVWRKVAPGDFIVLRGGEWRDIGHESRFLRTKYNTGTTPTGTIGTGPITIMGYPGENVIIHSATRGGIHNRGSASEAKWIVIANIKFRGGDITVIDAPINMQWGSDNWRIINNELYDWAAQSQDINGQRTEARAGGIAGNGNRVKILGNSIHGIGGGTKNHGIYIDFDGDPATVDDIEIGWNHLYNHKGGNLIQVFGSLGPIVNINIHHNLLHDGSRYGLNFSSNTKSDITVWNNIIYNTALAGLRFDTNNPQNVQIYNNVFYNVDITNVSKAAFANDYYLNSATVKVTNNIVVPAAASQNYMGGAMGSWGAAVVQNNLWFGKGAAPSLDSKAVGGDPLFRNPVMGDFSIMPGSPACDSGMSVAGLINDYSGVSRPIDGDNNGSMLSDIGAFEYAAVPDATPPSAPTGLTVM